MDPRYGRRLSPPPRRYVASGRNSTGRLDTDYESYYQPRGSNPSIISGPRTSAERIIPRTEPRLGIPSRTNNDDYYVAPRYPEGTQGGRRPLSIITPAGSSSRYRPVISSATNLVSSPYSKSRGRDDESFYIQPASSHGRHSSMGSSDIARYASIHDRERDRDRDLPAYRSSGRKHGEYLSPMVPSRDPREWDRDYEYPDRDQLYRDMPSRPRTRRVSDIDSRDRPSSVILGGADDYRRQQGPPVTTRGLAKIDDDGSVQREYQYRYPRDEPHSRESSLHRSSRDERDRTKSSRSSVTLHQDEGHSSSTEQRSRDKSHRHRHRDSTNRDRHTDDERRDESTRKHHGTDHDERHHRSHRHRDEFEEHRGSRDVRDEGYERDDDRERLRRSDESRKSKHGDRKLAEGAAIGAAAAVGAGGLVAEGIKHRRERDGSEIESDTIKDRSQRHRHKEDSAREKEGGDDEGEEDRRERRRRRRREREEKDRRDRDGEASSSLRSEEQHSRDSRSSVVPIPSSEDSRDLRSDEAESRKSRRHGRHRREQDSSSDSDSSSDAQRVRVVSPARDASRKPKGILRPPTQKFPEDPAPIREGVAPLKNSGKKGIPPDARWTRISRKVVNPAALELAQERYEESEDTVIVLRVLTKDEIDKYAFITQELRSRRAAEQQSKEEETRAIDDRPYTEESSESEKPKQIAAHAHNEHEAQAPPPANEIATRIGEDDEDRPSLQKEASYQRYAPPGFQPQSNIPVYPTIPGRSSASQLTTSPTPQAAHDPTYPSQGGGYKPSNSST